MEFTEDVKKYIGESNAINWYKPDCEVCGQGAMLCHDSRCPSNSSMRHADYRRDEQQKIRDKRNVIQRFGAWLIGKETCIHQ